jgi:peptidyl-prolyl cis-trans isomerase C
MAQQHSDCTSGKNGGSLGQVTRGETVPEFETFLCNLEEGQLCPVPVQTRYGAHVLRLDRRIGGRELPFETVRDRIAGYLQEASWRRAASQYIGLLAGAAAIEGADVNGFDSPLVQ